MTEKIVVVERGSRGRAVIGVFVVAFILIAVFFTVYASGYWQPPAGDDEGPNQRVWFKTSIVCSNAWILNPGIESIKNTRISTQTMYNTGRFINPLWDEECILAVEITYPNGKTVAFNDKPVYLGNGFPERYHFDYSWYTTWSGQHKVVVKLFEDAHGGRGSLFDSKSKNVDV